MQQLHWSLKNALPSSYSDWSDYIILTRENILDNFDLPLFTILLVSFYNDHIADFDFHWLFFMSKIMPPSESYQVFMNPSFPSWCFLASMYISLSLLPVITNFFFLLEDHLVINISSQNHKVRNILNLAQNMLMVDCLS